jgi:pyrophosphate--fructose-6-phosphate 1-phosphotransferase
VYSSLVGNLATDAASARKYFYFVRIMGRTPSHITLECANLAQPNMALIGEELEARRMTLAEIVDEIADMVAERAAAGKHYGVVLIPEGLLEYVPQVRRGPYGLNTRGAHSTFAPAGTPAKPQRHRGPPLSHTHTLPSPLPQVNALLKEISAARRLGASSHDTVAKMLTPYSAALLDSMPAFIQAQLMLEQQASAHLHLTHPRPVPIAHLPLPTLTTASLMVKMW